MQVISENIVPYLAPTYRQYKVLTTMSYNERESEVNSIIYQNKERIDILSKFYIFDNTEEIEDFLLTNDYLIDILLDAVSHIDENFGDANKHLELYHDPDEDSPILFIIVESPYSTEENISRQDELIESWFINVPNKARRKLSIEIALLQENKPHELKYAA